MAKRIARVVEYGDYQTPFELAALACEVLKNRGIDPVSVLEPTCGTGNMLLAALERFPTISTGLGIDVNAHHVAAANDKLAQRRSADKITIMRASFFDVDWPSVLRDLAEPILVVGNPPWVTNSAVGALRGSNLPDKSNYHNRTGLEALTGRSNFDISEWMLVKLLDVLAEQCATVAMFCKTAVARKVLAHAWKKGINVSAAEIHPIDATAFFGAAVDACLLVCSLSSPSQSTDCRVYRQLGDVSLVTTIGYHDDQLVADVAAYERWKHLRGSEVYRWRSGVKHDCSKVMELRAAGNQFRNGFDEVVDLEDDYLFPMLKSSDITNGQGKVPTRWMLVTQREVGAETAIMRIVAPKTWAYLCGHSDLLDRRASSIYRNRARFSIFGVGDYTFSPWKVCISGFYKQLHFAVVGPHQEKPVVLDDTSYFVSCRSEPEARCVADLLNSRPAREFFSSFVFWDSKRPITIDVLRRLDLWALAQEVDMGETLATFHPAKSTGKLAPRQPG